MITAIIIDSIQWPRLIKHPSADRHQTKTAVVILLILFASRLKINPALKNPVPVTTCAIILDGSPPVKVEIYVKIKEPNNTSVTDLTPIIPCVFCLSYPINAPMVSKSAKLIKNFIIKILFAH